VKSYTENMELLYAKEDIHGYLEKDLRNLEKEKGVSLPDALYQYYLQVGKMQVNSAHNRLFPPEELEIMDGYLVFMQENQSVVLWSVKESELNSENPNVYQGPTYEGTIDQWYSEGSDLEFFLNQMILFQTIMGGYESVATLDYTQEVKSYFNENWEKLSYSNDQMYFYFKDSVLVLFMFYENTADIYVAAFDDSLLNDFETRSGLSLSWL